MRVQWKIESTNTILALVHRHARSSALCWFLTQNHLDSWCILIELPCQYRWFWFGKCLGGVLFMHAWHILWIPSDVFIPCFDAPSLSDCKDKVCCNEVRKFCFLWVKLSAWWWRSMNWWTWCCSAHLYSWLYRWIFATTLKLKKSYVNSSFSSCFFIRRRPSEMEYSPSFPFQNTKQFWIRILSERRIHHFNKKTILFNDEKHAPH